jgi:hypothetical protein
MKMAAGSIQRPTGLKNNWELKSRAAPVLMTLLAPTGSWEAKVVFHRGTTPLLPTRHNHSAEKAIRR